MATAKTPKKSRKDADEEIRKALELMKRQSEAPKPEPKKKDPGIKLFNRWDVSAVVVSDRGLANIINTDPIILPKTGGRHAGEYLHKNRMTVVERFINRLMVPGHKGKKHKYTSGRCPASSQAIMKAMILSFEIIEKKSGKNPVQVLVQAVENAAVNDEIAAYRMGGTIARQSVTVSPRRRLDLSLRHLTQGIYKIKFNHKGSLPQVIADELMAAAANDPKSFAVQERSRSEKEAEGAR